MRKQIRDSEEFDHSKGFRIYKNLHKDCYTILGYVHKKGWLIYMYSDYVVSFGNTYKVSQAGRQRVLDTNVKNVHAFVQCKNFLTSKLFKSTYNLSWEITYNPKQYRS